MRERQRVDILGQPALAAKIGLVDRPARVADASWAVDKVDLRGKRWPAEDVHALSLAHLHGEYATVVDTAMTLEAAAMAKARERWRAERARGG